MSGPSWPPGPVPHTLPAGDALVLNCPRCPPGRCRLTRSGMCHDCGRVPVLPADLDGGLRRLKLAAMRRLAPELLVTAKTRRWNPEEFLRTLIDAEITARDESNTRTRMKAAAFPVVKTHRGVRRRRVLDPARDLRLPRLPGMDPGRRELLRGRPRGRHR